MTATPSRTRAHWLGATLAGILAAVPAAELAAQQETEDPRRTEPLTPVQPPPPPTTETPPSPEPIVDPAEEEQVERQEFDKLGAAVVYNDEEIQFRYRFETDNPSWYHSFRSYQDGEWVNPDDSEGHASEYGFNEDRISVMIDDGNVPGFADYGGYLTAHPGVRSLPGEATSGEVDDSFIADWGLGSDVRKFLAQTRDLPEDADPAERWKHPVPPEEIERLQEEGNFISSIQWRSHRSGPIGYGDPGYVLVYRSTAEGTGPYTSNWDSENNRPLYMFDPEVAGHAALDLEGLKEQRYGQDDYYYLAEGHMVPFDPEHEWQEGDTLPAHYLREPDGSRGAARATGRYEDGAWHVTITRGLEAVNPLDSKTFEPGNVYNLQFAVHSGGVGERYHEVSMPLRLSLGAGDADAHLQAVYTDGSLGDAEADLVDVPLFYPGVLTYDEVSEEGSTAASLLRLAGEEPLNPHRLRTLQQFILTHERLAYQDREEDGDGGR